MKQRERWEEAVRLVHTFGSMAVEDLAERLDASRETIRRDLAALDAQGLVKKFHGGARSLRLDSAGPNSEGPFTVRMHENAGAKRRIADVAARIAAPGDCLFIDTGTTTVYFAEALAKTSSLTIVTNSARIAATSAVNPGHRVFLLGGSFSPDAGETLGGFAISQLDLFHARYAFLTVGAAAVDGLSDFDDREADMARAMIGRAEKLVVLADRSKFERKGLFSVCRWADVDILVTDAPPPDAVLMALEENRVRLVLV